MPELLNTMSKKRLIELVNQLRKDIKHTAQSYNNLSDTFNKTVEDLKCADDYINDIHVGEINCSKFQELYIDKSNGYPHINSGIPKPAISPNLLMNTEFAVNDIEGEVYRVSKQVM